MTQTKFDYSITIQGNELDAKAAQNLNVGDSLLLSRLYDELDSFEIVITTQAGKELDMLSYPESVGIAPFLDDGSVKVLSAVVTNISLQKGKTAKTDRTIISFCVCFDYDEKFLKKFTGGTKINAFMPIKDIFYSLCLYRCLDYELPIITQTHLNRYEFEVDIDHDTKPFFDFDFTDENYFYTVQVLFNEAFTECKISGKIYSDSCQRAVELDEKSAEEFLTLVNHQRIFDDQSPIDLENLVVLTKEN